MLRPKLWDILSGNVFWKLAIILIMLLFKNTLNQVSVSISYLRCVVTRCTYNFYKLIILRMPFPNIFVCEIYKMYRFSAILHVRQYWLGYDPKFSGLTKILIFKTFGFVTEEKTYPENQTLLRLLFQKCRGTFLVYFIFKFIKTSRFNLLLTSS